jgi:hypothetical protein
MKTKKMIGGSLMGAAMLGSMMFVSTSHADMVQDKGQAIHLIDSVKVNMLKGFGQKELNAWKAEAEAAISKVTPETPANVQKEMNVYYDRISAYIKPTKGNGGDRTFPFQREEIVENVTLSSLIDKGVAVTKVSPDASDIALCNIYTIDGNDYMLMRVVNNEDGVPLKGYLLSVNPIGYASGFDDRDGDYYYNSDGERVSFIRGNDTISDALEAALDSDSGLLSQWWDDYRDSMSNMNTIAPNGVMMPSVSMLTGNGEDGGYGELWDSFRLPFIEQWATLLTNRRLEKTDFEMFNTTWLDWGVLYGNLVIDGDEARELMEYSGATFAVRAAFEVNL